MKLRQIFEGLGQEVAIIFGRFNPPHKGHRAAWELAAKSPIWYVGTNESTVGPKDPLPYGIKVEAMTAIWPEVEGHIIAETSWLTLASLVYEKHGDVTLLCLTDEDWVTKTIIQYNGKEGGHGFYNFKTIKQKPTPRLSSATALRDAVTKDDREAFANAAGVDADTSVAGKPFFDLVAEYLLPYSNAPVKKPAKKKVAAPVEGVAEAKSDAMAQAAKRLTDPNDGKTAKLRAAGDKRREEHLKGRDIAKRNESMLPASTFAGSSKYKIGQAGQWRNDGASKDRPARRGDLVGSTDESEGSPEGLPHLTKTMLTHIVQQVGSEGAHAIIKSLNWGDGASKELLHLIVKDIEDDIKANDFKQEDVDEGIMSFLKSEPPKKKWNSAKDSRVVSNRKDDEAWIKLLLDKHRRGIELTDREWNSIQQWKLKRDMKGEDAAGVGIITKQNSTVDVNKSTPRKNLKAFKLV